MKIRITFPWCVLLLLLLLHVFLLSFPLLLLSLLLMKRYSEIYNFKATLFANSKWLRIESRRASLKSPQRKCKLNDATKIVYERLMLNGKSLWDEKSRGAKCRCLGTSAFRFVCDPLVCRPRVATSLSPSLFISLFLFFYLINLFLTIANIFPNSFFFYFSIRDTR